jgi:Tfp pilus assembly protein PilN
MTTQTFLPEDYIAHKAERRTNIICVILFVVVMVAVFGAFLVTNRQWSKVKENQQSINVQYQQAALKIQKLNELEAQREEMLSKAELAAALVERVPRSILLAELINRMPARLGLLEFELKSEKMKHVAPPPSPGAKGSLREPERGKTREQVDQSLTKIEAPRYQVSLTMVGVAPTDLEVSRYMAELNAYTLARDVTLEYSEEKQIENRLVREFKITMKLDPDADVRTVEPLIIHRRIPNPMDDTLQFGAPSPGSLPTTLDEGSPQRNPGPPEASEEEAPEGMPAASDQKGDR